MAEKTHGRIRLWLAKYRRWILLLLAVYVGAILVLILLAGGPQLEPFRYQIF